MQYAYIKDGKLVSTSDMKIQQLQHAVIGTRTVTKETLDELGKVIETAYVDETFVESPAVDGMAFDEMIETKLEGRICYEGGKIVAWDKSAEKKAEDMKTAEDIERQTEESRKTFRRRVGELAIERAAAEELGEDTQEIDTKLREAKIQYASV